MKYYVDWFGDDNLVFSTDYPHGDSKYPHSVTAFMELPLTRGVEAQDPLGQLGPALRLRRRDGRRHYGRELTAMGYTEESLSEKGAEIQAQLWGEQMLRGGGGGVPGAQLAPEFFQLVRQFCFGMFWGREGLDVKHRSLVTVSQLAALGKLEELKGHLRGALNVGWTKEELVEVMMHTAVYCGVPAGVNALNAAAEVLQD